MMQSEGPGASVALCSVRLYCVFNFYNMLRFTSSSPFHNPSLVLNGHSAAIRSNQILFSL